MSGADPEILIVDDDSLNLFVSETMLRRAGYKTARATNGQEAVAAVASARPAMIIMDLSMPLMDGIEAAEEIHRMTNAGQSRIPIVALTANVTNRHAYACAASGFEGFLTKPVRMEDLLSLVGRFVDADQAEAETAAVAADF
ncbi:MAG: response regulator [Pseudomonadota bacterium]